MIPRTADSYRAASALGVARRRERGGVLSALRQGDLSIYEVLTDRPECVHELPVHALCRSVRGVGQARMIVLGDEAIRADVNLFLPVLAMSRQERAWVASRLGQRVLRFVRNVAMVGWVRDEPSRLSERGFQMGELVSDLADLKADLQVLETLFAALLAKRGPVVSSSVRKVA